jgi:hypothetical protein
MACVKLLYHVKPYNAWLFTAGEPCHRVDKLASAAPTKKRSRNR